MALRTNSKKARENVRAYILNNFRNDEETRPTFEEASAAILEEYRDRLIYRTSNGYGKMPESDHTFLTEYCYTLPGVLSCDFVLCRAVNDLGAILEETETEKSRFSEYDACRLLAHLIFDELKKAETRARR